MHHAQVASQTMPQTHGQAELQTRSVVLLSGGLDSVVSLAVALQTGQVLQALTIDYGQRAFVREHDAAQAVAAHYGIPHRSLTLPWMADLLPPGMQSLPPADGAENQAATADARTRETQTLTGVWVPNRNGILLNLAAAYAEAIAADAVIFGANWDEAQAFPDNSLAYCDALTAAFAYSTRNGVRVFAPLAQLTKAQIIARGRELQAPLHLSWSCYTDLPTPCGVCLSCQHAQGLVQA
jgi:7-cyano-7-deazaguanine synthase